MHRIILLLGMLLCTAFTWAQQRSLHFQLDLGGGTYLGDFREHLERDGAWLNSPSLDAALLIYPGKHLGLGIQWGSMAVLHPHSAPMEGILRYQGILLEGQWNRGPFWLSPYGALGFQDPGMTLGYYGSGYFDVGLHLGWEFQEQLSLTLGAGYRRTLLRSVILAQQYNLEENDTLSSLRISLGLRAVFR